MPRLMDIGLEKLTNLVLEMASLSEKSVSTSIESYSSGKNLTGEIKKWSDELRKMQEDVSGLSIELIARYQPVASDLRFIESCMEISYGFLRFGRYAYDIAEVLEMFGNLSDCDHKNVDVTAKTTKEMIRMSIDAFTKRDLELAKNIEKLDDFVDEKYREHISESLKNPNVNLKCAMSATLILRYLERISDHSAYIGDSVMYIVSGQRSPRK
ncbi:MAG: PhoU domain-containing protein [archaeon]|nr:PhoU domain-containing protein [archaeon]